MFVLLLIFFLLYLVKSDNFVQQRFKCYDGRDGSGTGCWIIPNECYTTDQTCLSALSWVVESSYITFTFAVYNDDLHKYLNTYGGYYVALGLSLDETMGADTVIVCVTNAMGNSTVYLSWNDGTHNYRLYKESDLLISQAEVSAAGKITCQWRWNLDAYNQLPADSLSKIYNLSDNSIEYHFLLARGSADAYTYNIHMHSISPGNLYPFISTETTTFCSPSCSQPSYDWLTDFKQDQSFSQLTKQKFILTHLILMLILLFVLFPTSIMIARFGKDYLNRCCHQFVWFQLHRLINSLGFCCLSVAIFLIFYQSDRNTFKCTEMCEIYVSLQHKCLTPTIRVDDISGQHRLRDTF
uniref:DOMON domain-containing protein n=1 Tax=Bursaphelenchus xylophilus TaxID=6326 RepID=A0A1I7SI28_BURXY